MKCAVVFIVCLSCISKSFCIEGKYTKNIQNAIIVYPVRVTKDGNYIEDQKLEQRFKRSEVSQEPTIHYKINLRKKVEFIDLIPNARVFSPGAVLELHTNDSTFPDQLSNIKTKLLSDQQCIYTGRVRGYEDSSTALSTCDGLSGFIRIKRKTFFIEPVRDNISNLEEEPHAIYEHIRGERTSPNCAVNEPIKHKAIKHSNRRQRPSRFTNTKRDSARNDYNKSTPLHLESLVVMDNAMIKNHLPHNDLENYVMTVLNMVQSLLHDLNLEPSINFELVRMVQVLDDAEEINQGKDKSTEELLKFFSAWQDLINPRNDNHPNHHDIAILLTGNDICDQNGNCHYLGIAERNGICRPKRQATVCKDNGLLLGHTLAHEIAHNLGIEHDTGFGNSCNPTMPDGSSSVMNPTISFKSREWSKCSQDSLRNLIESGAFICLEDDPTAQHINDVDILPGVIYGGDFQCRRLYTSDASDCSNERNCQSLQCHLKGTPCSNTGLLPAPGTSCGPNKWCYEGDCVEAGKRPESVQGGWSAWSEWGPCTRSCGSGITVSTRDCNNPTPRQGGKMCPGQRKRLKVCSTEPCPVGSISFRDVQCAEYNNWIFPEDNKSHTWKGFFISNGNPCALTCKNENNEVVSLTPKVIDGTTCYRGLRDVCIDGVCRDIPCDLQFDSNSVEDSCGICHGNGTECKILQGTKKFEGLSNIIPSIPARTRAIKMKVLKPINSHIMVKAVNNKELFNDGEKLGMFRVPGSVAWLGMIKPKQEMLEIPGPIEQPISIWVTSEGSQTVAYSMGLPSGPREGIYTWDRISWLPCKAQCGDGYQEAETKCVEIMSGLVEDKYCKDIEKPRIQRRTCNAGPCFARWLIGEWKECGPCPSSEGKRFRLVRCIKPIAGSEEGTAFVPSEECPGSRPASSEHCSCLKRQASYWPPRFRSRSLPDNFRKVFLNGYKIRRTRSTKTPEKKVTLMQLENESEESMLKQFKENQRKRYPFLFMPSLFGTRFNFTIPLKKRQALFLEKNEGNLDKDLMKKIIDYESCGNSLNELEKYPEQLLSYSSYCQTPADNTHLPYNYLPARQDFNAAGFNNMAEFSSIDKHFIKNITKDIRPINLPNTPQTPLHFSDHKILKILSDNLALHKLQQHQNLKLSNKAHYSSSPPKKSTLENYYDRRNFDFLNLIGNQLYRALEMQAYLQSLLNSSQKKISIDPFKKIVNEQVVQPVKYKLPPPFNNKTEILDFDLGNNSFEKKPLHYANLKQFNVSSLRSKNGLGACSKHLVELHPISNRKLKPFNEFLINFLKPNTKHSENVDSNVLQIKEGTTDNSSIFRLRDMNIILESTTFFPKIKQNSNEESLIPLMSHSYYNQEYKSNENKLVDEIINKLRYLPHENKLRLHHDLVHITEYLKYLLSYDMVSSVNSMGQADYYNNSGLLLKNVRSNFGKSSIQEVHNSHKEKSNREISELFGSFFENNFKNDYLMNHSKIEARNKFRDKLNNFYDQMSSKEKYNRLIGSHTSQNKNLNIMKQYEDVLNELKNGQLSKIVGPLRFVYPIPEGRLCTTTTTAACEIKSPCRIKKSVVKIPSSFILNTKPKISQKYASLGNDYISVKITALPKNSHSQNNFFKSVSQIEMNKSKPSILHASTNNVSLYVNGSEFVSPKCDQKIVCCDNKNNGLLNTSSTVSTKQEVDTKNDSFYNPPDFDFKFDNKHVICEDNLMHELQKELQLTRHRKCKKCYYLYKDETTLPPKCLQHR